MQALVVTVPATEAELASDLLWSLGVLAVEERDGGGTPGLEDHLVELWTSLGEDVEEVTRAAEAFPARWRWHLVEVDESVADNWRAHVGPVWVTDRIVIVPSWIDFEPPPGQETVCLRIEPGETFGLGDHPTTVLTARALSEELHPGQRVLDVGCGSGVLGVLAAVSGAGHVVGIDLHPAAVPVTVANAVRNGVSSLVEVSLTPLADVEGPFELVLANILAPALIELSDDLKRVLAPGGTLVISGVLVGAHDHVLAALAPLVPVRTLERDGWAATVLR
jgi:ribosomal protein L11 methyltransferase